MYITILMFEYVFFCIVFCLFCVVQLEIKLYNSRAFGIIINLLTYLLFVTA